MISMIWAQALDGTIGVNNEIPWHVPEDFAHFKKQTMNSTVIMGRNTWESLPKKPLPKRRNIVLTSNKSYVAEGAEIYHNIDLVLQEIKESDENVWIIGGGKIYEEFMEYVDRIVITEIGYENNNPDSVKAPCIDENIFSGTPLSEDLFSRTGFKYKFLEYIRSDKCTA